MKTSENKISCKWEYSIFKREIFDKQTIYTLCRRELSKPKKWWQKLFESKYEHLFNGWESVSDNRLKVSVYNPPYFTESVEKINEFMDWNIKKDNEKIQNHTNRL